jgi:hypothetical protein
MAAGAIWLHREPLNRDAASRPDGTFLAYKPVKIHLFLVVLAICIHSCRRKISYEFFSKQGIPP